MLAAWIVSALAFMIKENVCIFVMIFFFQAEDGIRDVAVTGVQTCALPICLADGRRTGVGSHLSEHAGQEMKHVPGRRFMMLGQGVVLRLVEVDELLLMGQRLDRKSVV